MNLSESKSDIFKDKGTAPTLEPLIFPLLHSLSDLSALTGTQCRLHPDSPNPTAILMMQCLPSMCLLGFRLHVMPFEMTQCNHLAEALGPETTSS